MKNKQWWVLVVAVLVSSVGAMRAAADDKTDVGNAAKAWATALMAGDTAAMKAHSIGDKDQVAHWEGMSKMIASFKKMAAAAEAKYGEQASMMSRMLRAPDFSQFDKESKIEVAGDEATIVSDGKQPTKMKLKKEGGEWKVELATLNDASKMDATRITGMSDAASTTADEIKDGKYPTFRDAMMAFGQKMQALGGGARPGGRPGAPR
jgi:hypothetical protein